MSQPTNMLRSTSDFPQIVLKHLIIVPIVMLLAGILRVVGRPVTMTKSELCEMIPSRAELAEVPDNIPLESANVSSIYVYRQRLELIDYVPRQPVLVSFVEDSSTQSHPRTYAYIAEAKLPRIHDIASAEHDIASLNGRFRSPTADVEIRRCGDIDIQFVLTREDDESEDSRGEVRGLTLQWHPPQEDVGPVDIYITKLNIKQMVRRRGRHDNMLPQ